MIQLHGYSTFKNQVIFSNNTIYLLINHIFMSNYRKQKDLLYYIYLYCSSIFYIKSRNLCNACL